MHQTEKRHLQRFNLEIPAKVQFISTDAATRLLDLYTGNVCSGGAYLKTARPLPVGTPIQVELLLPLDKFKNLSYQYTSSRIRLSGRVLHTASSGMGVCFDTYYQMRPTAKGTPQGN